jgi:hypothetical protein
MVMMMINDNIIPITDYDKVQVKAKFALEQAMTTQKESRGMA